MIRFLVPAALLLTSACAGGGLVATPAAVVKTPQPVVLTAKERLVAAIEDNNCVLTADNVGAVLNDATISREELLQLTPQLQAEGRVEVSGSGSIRVMSDRCI